MGFPHAHQAAELRRFSERPVKTKSAQPGEQVEREYLLASLSPQQLSVRQMLQWDRQYWGIENGMHLRLDVSGQEDKSRVRNRRAAFNLCLFRRAAHSFAVHWIQRQPNPRRATTTGFYDDMTAHGHRKAFSLVTVRTPSWIPKK